MLTGAGGYYVWGTPTAINQQIVMYLLSRIIIAAIKVLASRRVQPFCSVSENQVPTCNRLPSLFCVMFAARLVCFWQFMGGSVRRNACVCHVLSGVPVLRDDRVGSRVVPVRGVRPVRARLSSKHYDRPVPRRELVVKHLGYGVCASCALHHG